MPEDIHQTPTLIPSHELIIRIDERTRAMEKTLTHVEQRVANLETKVSDLGPMKMIVFGGVGIILMAVIGALLAYVIYNPGGH